jgi:two-component sensor histidine kinase
MRMKEATSFLAGGGEMGALTRAHHWASTALGPPDVWPQSLQTAMGLLLNTQHPMFIWWGSELIQFYNDVYRQTMGPERHPGALGQRGRECWEEIWDIIGPQIEQVMAGKGATWHEDHLVPMTRHGKREDVWWTYSFSPIHDEGEPNGIGGVLVICRDVTERHRLIDALLTNQRRLSLVTDELNHRIKNTLATVQAIASQTFRGGATMGEARATFESRLIALANAHDLLTGEQWAGAELAAVIEGAVTAYAGNTSRFEITGPPVHISPRSALAFAMAIHELCTNAAKYGALSTAVGQVSVSWKIEEVRGELEFLWVESGGPPVQPPTRKGFGSRLIETSLAAELGGEVHLAYRPGGVVCAIRALHAAVTAR